MNLLLGSLTIGIALSLLALAVYITFRIFGFSDMTVDGTFTLGASVAAVLLVKGTDPALATFLGAAAGFLAGLVTGVIHTRFRIHGLLSGILVMTALYSVNLRVMGRSNISLLDARTLCSWAEGAALPLFGGRKDAPFLGWSVATRDLAVLFFAFLLVAGIAACLYLFFRTALGTAMRATGDNPQMVRALGADTRNMILAGLGLSNGLAALSGALLAQYQGFADVQMGIGMIVWGLASVIIGEALLRSRRLGLVIAGTVMGAVLFRLMVAIALRFGLNPNDLKLITALSVFFALIVPGMWEWARGLRRRASKKAIKRLGD